MSARNEVMKLDIRARGLQLSPAEREEAERAFWFTLGKFESELRRVDIALGYPDDARSGWLQCRIYAVGCNGAALLVEGADRDVVASVGRTLRRAEREMRRRALGARRRALPGHRGAA